MPSGAQLESHRTLKAAEDTTALWSLSAWKQSLNESIDRELALSIVITKENCIHVIVLESNLHSDSPAVAFVVGKHKRCATCDASHPAIIHQTLVSGGDMWQTIFPKFRGRATQ